MTWLPKLSGGVMLLLSMVWVSGNYRARIARRAESVRALRSLMQQLRHAVQQTGMPLAEWMRGVMADEALLRSLGVSEAARPEGCDGGQAGFAWLCRTAARELPTEHAATESLLRLGDEIGAACGREHLEELLQSLEGKLAALEQETERTLKEHCRVVQTLCICGALAAILLLW